MVRPYGVDFDDGAEGVVGDMLDWGEVIPRGACSFEHRLSNHRPDKDVQGEWKGWGEEAPRTTNDKVNPPELFNRLLYSLG